MKVNLVFCNGLGETLHLLDNHGKPACTCSSLQLDRPKGQPVPETNQVHRRLHQITEDDVCAVSWVKIQFLAEKLPQWGVKV